MPLACGLLVGAFTAEAHHSISGMYDSRRDGRWCMNRSQPVKIPTHQARHRPTAYDAGLPR